MDKLPDLEKITRDFIAATGLVPLVSAEIEFYSSSDLQPETCNHILTEANIETYGLERERGDNQYELALKKPTTPLEAAEQIKKIKSIFGQSKPSPLEGEGRVGGISFSKNDPSPSPSLKGRGNNIEANFAAKPYPDQPGSGLHIHLSLHDKDGINIFAKKGDEEETQAMRYVIAGLLETMLENFAIFAPNKESYARFALTPRSALPLSLGERGWGEGAYNNAPINVSWGGNNRTTAIRIPASTAWPLGRHIEHRVSGADANPHAVIAAILIGSQKGLLAKQEPTAKIWGDASHPQYAPLRAFPKTLEEALSFV